MVSGRWLVLVAIALLIAASACRRQEPAPPRVITETLVARSTVPDPAAQACAQCHADIVAEWASSQHANANRLVSDALDRAAFDPPTTLAHGSFITTMARTRDGDFTFSVAFSNQPAATYIAEAVIGITPLRQYLVTFPGGRLQTVDVSFDPRSNEWFNAFGDENRQPHEWGFWKNRSMTWNVQCAFCHMTGFEKNYDIPTDTYNSTWQAMGISCAQCHTPKAQVSGLNAKVPGKTNECPMVEPFHPDTRHPTPDTMVMDNCASCHARREELFGTFKPGDRFHDHFRLTLPDSPGVFHHDGQVLQEDFEYGSFAMSRMGHAGVTCLDCHNPHSGQLVAPVENNALCMQCHTPPGLNGAIPIDPAAHSFHTPGTPGGRCVDCHMPVHHYMVRDGRRDHGFTSPDPLLTIELGIPNACTMCHTDQSAEWAHEKTVAWYGDKMNRRARDRARVVARAHAGDPDVAPDLLAMAATEDIAAWRTALNSLLAPAAQRDDVAAHLVTDLTHSNPMVRAAATRSLAERPDLLANHPHLATDDSALVRLDAAWAAPDLFMTTPANLRDIQAYLANIADQPPGALRQAQHAMNRNDLASAETWASKALAWDPTPVPQYALGRIQHLRGNIYGAVSNLAAAANADRTNAEYSYALALFYAENQRTDLALPWLEETVRRDQTFGRAWYNLGLAYSQTERLDEAINALARAETILTTSPDPAYARATIHARRQETALARAAATRALAIDPSHQPSRQLLRALER